MLISTTNLIILNFTDHSSSRINSQECIQNKQAKANPASHVRLSWKVLLRDAKFEAQN